MKKYAICAAAVIVVVAACSPSNDNRPPEPPAQSDIPFRQDATLTFLRDTQELSSVRIEIADNDSSRTRGLMQRSSLEPGTGMLFIFPESDNHSFWMANTQVSLDIIFVDADSVVVDVHRYTRPLSDQNVGGQRVSRFVVEVPAGYADTYGIIEGDRIRWSR